MLVTSSSFTDKDTNPGSPAPPSPQRRSKLHESSTKYWLQKRHSKTANMKYLLFPNEIQQHTEFLNVFENFDVDHSGKLTINEFYNMLKHAHIKVDKKDLREFYKRVDDNNDTELDFREFKNCTMSNEANFYFSQMMERSRENSPNKTHNDSATDQNPDKSPQSFLPRTFGNLLHYLTYDNKKRDIIKFVKNKNIGLDKKFEKFSELFELQIKDDKFLEKGTSKDKEKDTTKPPVFNSSQSFSSKGSFEYPKTDNLTPNPSSTQEYFPSRQDKLHKEKSSFLKEIMEISAKAEQQAKEEVHQSIRVDMSRKSFRAISPSVAQSIRLSVPQSRENLNASKISQKIPDTLSPKIGTLFFEDGKTPTKSLRSNCGEDESFSALLKQTELFRKKSDKLKPEKSPNISPRTPSELDNRKQQQMQKTFTFTGNSFNKSAVVSPVASPVKKFSNMLVNIFPSVTPTTPVQNLSEENKTPASVLKITSPSSRKTGDRNDRTDSEGANRSQNLPRIVLSPSNLSSMSRVPSRLNMTEQTPSIRIIRNNEPTHIDLSPIASSNVAANNQTFSYEVARQAKNVLSPPKQTRPILSRVSKQKGSAPTTKTSIKEIKDKVKVDMEDFTRCFKTRESTRNFLISRQSRPQQGLNGSEMADNSGNSMSRTYQRKPFRAVSNEPLKMKNK